MFLPVGCAILICPTESQILLVYLGRLPPFFLGLKENGLKLRALLDKQVGSENGDERRGALAAFKRRECAVTILMDKFGYERIARSGFVGGSAPSETNGKS